MTPKERASAIAAAVWISTKEKHALEQDIAAAIRAAVGFEWRTGLTATVTDAQGIGFDGRLSRITISFTVPAPVAGIA